MASGRFGEAAGQTGNRTSFASRGSGGSNPLSSTHKIPGQRPYSRSVSLAVGLLLGGIWEARFAGPAVRPRLIMDHLVPRAEHESVKVPISVSDSDTRTLLLTPSRRTSMAPAARSSRTPSGPLKFPSPTGKAAPRVALALILDQPLHPWRQSGPLTMAVTDHPDLASNVADGRIPVR
jgi:hypothetical protein